MTPRLVYLDLGTHLGDTLDGFRVLAAHPFRDVANWEIYGFEASPRIIPFVDKLVQWKNGEAGIEKPVCCLPPAGSTHDTMYYAHLVGCKRGWAARMNFCMNSFLKEARARMVPDRVLQALPNVQRRLSAANVPLGSSAVRPRFTFIPAAVGNSNGTFKSLDQAFGFMGARPKEEDMVRMVDFEKWLRRNFRREDYVVMKCDIEGGEFSLMNKLNRTGTVRLLDKVAMECHPLGQCQGIPEMLNSYGIDVVKSDSVLAGQANWTERREEWRRDLLSPACAFLNASKRLAKYARANSQ